MKILDYETNIMVDGSNLTEYNMHYDDEGKVATCWVPSEAGKSFTVNLRSPRIFDDDACADLHADGSFVDCYVFHKHHLFPCPISTWVGKRISTTSIRPLLFSNIKLTEDDKYLNSQATEGLGTITVTIWRGFAGPEDDDPTFNNNPLFEGMIHERSKKASQHKIGLGAEIYNPVKEIYAFKRFSILCKFIFKYRPLDILRADGIAPPAFSAQERNGKRKVSEVKHLEGSRVVIELDDSEDEDEDENKPRIKQHHKENSSLKSKLASKDSNKKLKREHQPAPLGDVIDLTI